MAIEDNQPQDYYYDCQRYTTWIQEHVIGNDVHDYRSKKQKRKGYEPIHEQERTTYDLYRSHKLKVMRLCQRADKLACQS